MQYEKCKCGHDIIKAGNSWFHIRAEEPVDFDESYNLSTKCYYELDTPESRAFLDKYMHEVVSEIHEKFGDYHLDVWFMEIECNCTNPQPE